MFHKKTSSNFNFKFLKSGRKKKQFDYLWVGDHPLPHTPTHILKSLKSGENRKRIDPLEHEFWHIFSFSMYPNEYFVYSQRKANIHWKTAPKYNPLSKLLLGSSAVWGIILTHKLACCCLQGSRYSQTLLFTIKGLGHTNIQIYKYTNIGFKEYIYSLNPILDKMISFVRTSSSGSGYSTRILKRAGLESSGQIASS